MGVFFFAIGARQLYLGKTGEYAGWALFSEKMRHVIETIEKLSFISEVERVGLRYVNFFNFDIFDRINLIISLSNRPITDNETLVRTTIPGQRFTSRLHVANKTSFTVEGLVRFGSVIDIDTFLVTDLNDFFKNPTSIIEEGHTEEKTVFFTLLKDDFIQTLNPEY